MEGKTLLLLGGSGSLGNALVDRYLDKNEIYVLSRDESKHWAMQMKYHHHSHLHFVIGDIRDQEKIRQTLVRVQPHYVILAAAMKHIDRCEYETHECIATNLTGIQNVLDAVEACYPTHCPGMKAVCFISTDKACSPVNVYGMCKAIGEGLLVEKAKFVPGIKFVTVRYGNVLNSRGSIIPYLHEAGSNPEVTSFKLTDPRMTRFVMTLEQSVDLIEHAMLRGSSGDIIIPQLQSMWVRDLMELFSEKYNKPIVPTALRPGEKLSESLINETQSYRLVQGMHGYIYIKPSHVRIDPMEHKVLEVADYNSTQGLLGKEELRALLTHVGML